MSRYRVMSFDGGPGCFTFLHCLLFHEQRHPGFLAATDMFVGCSAGSWIALYLAHRLGEVDRGALTGADLIEECLEFMLHCAGVAVPDQATAAGRKRWRDFILGVEPLSDYAPVERIMNGPAAFGATRLGELPKRRRVIAVAGRMSAPWGPKFHDSHDPEDASLRLTEVAVRSGSCPVAAPIRDGLVDGALHTNNPAMIGVVRAIVGSADAAPARREDVVLLSLGSNDGSSKVSNLSMPHKGTPAAMLKSLRLPPPDLASLPSPASVGELVDDLRQLLSSFRDASAQVDHALDQVRDDHPLLGDQVTTSIRTSMAALRDRVVQEIAALAPAAPALASLLPPPSEEPPSTDPAWGWQPWLVYPGNFMYAMQVLLNSQGRGVAQQCDELLRPRFLRLGPVGLLPTNMALMLICFGAVRVVGEVGRVTARQWRVTEAPWREFFGYEPDAEEADRWVGAQWFDLRPEAAPPAA